MRVNYEAVNNGVLVEPIILLRDELWPAGQRLPQSSILEWMQDQHRHGISIQRVNV